MAAIVPERDPADPRKVIAHAAIPARMIAAGWCSDSTTNVSLPGASQVAQTI